MSSTSAECPRDGHGRLVVSSQADATRIAHDPERFSNAVSRHLQIPNGLDGAEHARATRLLAPFFHPPALDELEPRLAQIAGTLVGTLGARPFDAVADLGVLYAVRAQSAWLGWGGVLEDDLVEWVGEHRAAGRSGNPHAAAGAAARFDDIIRVLIAERRGRKLHDLTGLLMSLRWDDGRRISDDEVVSVLRNWTGGDLSSLALCVAAVVHWVATHPGHRVHLAAADDAAMDAAIDEILRLDDPFVSSRRRATADAEVSGCPVQAGETIVLDWRAANRDPEAFADPDAFDPVGHAARNLVYGTGVHACPGRGLATRELRVLLRAVLAAGEIDLAGPVVREEPPLAGFRALPVRVFARG
ncbi:cytochrome P450 [Microbacterium sp. B2969]|uniref:Cytochrome P450 n=1 Tax=Microbacterium alkaliflavum TaxID=3248839 RepID=A0ABW7Q2X0_9MICO